MDEYILHKAAFLWNQAAWFQRNAAFESTSFHLYVQMKGHPYN